MKLYIDSTGYNTVTYALVGKQAQTKTFKVGPHESHKTLRFLESFLKQFKVDLKTGVGAIVACSGPGSYTGTRVGVAHALALSLALKVPVSFLPKNKFPQF